MKSMSGAWPGSLPLAPLLKLPRLHDVLALQFPDQPRERWIDAYGSQRHQIDDLRVSDPLKVAFNPHGPADYRTRTESHPPKVLATEARTIETNRGRREVRTLISRAVSAEDIGYPFAAQMARVLRQREGR